MRKGEPIVVVKYVSKSYGKVEALKEVSLVVEQGKSSGLLVPMVRARVRCSAS